MITREDLEEDVKQIDSLKDCASPEDFWRYEIVQAVYAVGAAICATIEATATTKEEAT